MDRGGRGQPVRNVCLERVAVPDVRFDPPDPVGEGGLPALALEGGLVRRGRRGACPVVAPFDQFGELDGVLEAGLVRVPRRFADLRTGRDPEFGRLAAGRPPRGDAVEHAQLEPGEPVGDGRLGEVLEFAGDVVGEPSERAAGVRNVTPPAGQPFGFEEPIDRFDARAVAVPPRRRVRVHPNPFDGVDPEIAPSGLAAGRLEVEPVGVVVPDAPVGVERIRNGTPYFDGNAGSGRFRSRGRDERFLVSDDA